MEILIRSLLPTYFLLYFGIAFIAKSVIVARKIGKSPLVLPKDDSAYGLVGRYFKLTLIAMFVYVVAYALAPEMHVYFLPFISLNILPIQLTGILLLVLSLIWTILAQHHMRQSWRIGIDADTPTELITSGLFRYSRNPIFLGMLGSLAGLFCLTPNTPTFCFLIIGYILIQVQIRLEEEFLIRQHGANYQSYLQKTPRFLF